jgi:Leucine-rich repeat (LRR) protein
MLLTLFYNIFQVRPWLSHLPTLRRLDVSDNGLEELGWAALGPEGHPTLERLTLDNNRLRVVRRDALTALPALLELHLRNNSLDERSLLDAGSPWNLPGLKVRVLVIFYWSIYVK